MVEVKRSSDKTWVNRVVDYVTTRQNMDGGYTFCKGAESNAQDTYFGLAILNLLNTSFPNMEETIRFLEGLNVDSLFTKFYVTKALLLCNSIIRSNLREQISSSINSIRSFKPESFPALSSEFTTTFITLELANMLNLEVKSVSLARWLLSFKNEDGGFGSGNHSNINSTYYALASLNLLKERTGGMRETIEFVRLCEKPHGGFTVIPIGYTPYMEHTYYGVLALDLLGEKCRYPSQTIGFVLDCQNNNGGFARSDLGISTFENSFQAVSVIKGL